MPLSWECGAGTMQDVARQALCRRIRVARARCTRRTPSLFPRVTNYGEVLMH